MNLELLKQRELTTIANGCFFTKLEVCCQIVIPRNGGKSQNPFGCRRL